jgi:hypothetical protein
MDDGLKCSACGRPIKNWVAINLPVTAELASCCGIPICKDCWDEDLRCADAAACAARLVDNRARAARHSAP